VCLANLAAIYLARNKHISVVSSCERALQLWPDNAKAAFRAAKSCIALGRAAAALEFAEIGRSAAPPAAASPAAQPRAAVPGASAPAATAATAGAAGAAGAVGAAAPPPAAAADPFEALVREASALLARQERMALATRAEQAARDAALQAVRDGCMQRNIRVGPPLYATAMRRTAARPYLDADECMHWPVLLLYPQFSQTDFVEDVAESASLGDVLAAVMPRGAPRAAWDTRGEYVEGNVDVFFKTHPCAPLKFAEWWTRAAEAEGAQETWQTSRLVLVPPHAPLLFALIQPGYVVADIPCFYVVARSSECHAEMKRAAGGAFVTLRVPKEALPVDE